MITLKMSVLNNKKFTEGIAALISKTEFITVQGGYNASRIARQVDAHIGLAKADLIALKQKHTTKVDDKDTLNVEAFNVDVQALMDKEVILESFLVNAGDIKSINISAENIFAIEPILNLSTFQ